MSNENQVQRTASPPGPLSPKSYSQIKTHHRARVRDRGGYLVTFIIPAYSFSKHCRLIWGPSFALYLLLDETAPTKVNLELFSRIVEKYPDISPDDSYSRQVLLAAMSSTNPAGGWG